MNIGMSYILHRNNYHYYWTVKRGGKHIFLSSTAQKYYHQQQKSTQWSPISTLSGGADVVVSRNNIEIPHICVHHERGISRSHTEMVYIPMMSSIVYQIQGIYWTSLGDISVYPIFVKSKYGVLTKNWVLTNKQLPHIC